MKKFFVFGIGFCEQFLWGDRNKGDKDAEGRLVSLGSDLIGNGGGGVDMELTVAGWE